MKPNILYIMTDQQSATMMSCTGNKYLKTPSLDSIAKNGVRFDRAYCAAPVCVPSRLSLFTGKMPSYINLKANETDGVWHDKIDELKPKGIGYLMKDAGYDVAYAGKQHLPEFTADELGFDVLTLDDRDEATEKSIEYIKEDRDKPFFLVSSLINPHDICFMTIRDCAEPEQRKRFVEHGVTELKNVDTFLKPLKEGDPTLIEEKCPPLPINYMPQENEPGAIDYLLSLRSFRVGARKNYSDNDWRMHRYVYHRLTEMVDEKIGKIINALKESGQEENTVIIFTSDHGDMDSAHKMEHKTTFYDEASRIPLLISQKGVIPSGIVNTTHLISNGLDLIPTLCDYAEIDVPAGLEGQSFRPIAEGKELEPTREAIKIESEIGQMIVTQDYKYAKFFMGDNDEQLYDLKKDPYEMKNSAFLEENKDVLEYHQNLFNKLFDIE